jgi:hypothetical protein
MAARQSEKPEKPPLLADRDALLEKLSVSHFDLNAIIRGAQLTVVGG